MLNLVKTRSVLKILLFVGTLGAMGAVFQNCGRVSIVNGQQNSGIEASSLATTPVISLSENYVMTTLNQPVSVKVDSGLQNAVLSFQQGSVVTSVDLGTGKASIDPATSILTFTPNLGFRGNVSTNLYSSSQGVTNIQNITFTVSNSVLSFKPALAVRGPECMLCHAQVQGDLVTDFGFKSATETGPDLFLTGVDPNNTVNTAFGISQNGLDSLSSASIVGKLAIPAIDLTKIDPSISRAYFPLKPGATPVAYPFKMANPDTETPPVTTYAQFITSRGQAPANAGFQGITELNNIYIGAPLASDIMTAGQLSTTVHTNFFKNTQTAPDFSGISLITPSGTDLAYYGNKAGTPVVCEGDYFVDGPVLLDHAAIQTTYGCRIYSTHSVFVQGPITYPQVSALSNLEISSANGIFMGFGYCIDCANSVDHGYEYTNSLATRFAVIKSVVAVQAFRTRSFDDTVAAALADFAKTSDTPTGDSSSNPPPAIKAGDLTPDATYAAYYASKGFSVTQFDTSNPTYDQSKTSYSRLLLNAPVVMSRYSGDYKGVVIAEFAMWRLGQFTFNFDSVFTGVPLLPFLNLSTILNIQ